MFLVELKTLFQKSSKVQKTRDHITLAFIFVYFYGDFLLSGTEDKTVNHLLFNVKPMSLLPQTKPSPTLLPSNIAPHTIWCTGFKNFPLGLHTQLPLTFQGAAPSTSLPSSSLTQPTCLCNVDSKPD